MLIEYTKESPEIKFLSLSDHKMKMLLEEVGIFKIMLSEDYFSKLISSIIGQQLSVKATQTIWHRFKALSNEINPQNVLEIDDASMRLAGVSSTKISYIKGLAEKVLEKKIDINSLCDQEDNEVIETLTGVKGIGRWTAEMFLIFSLGRKDVMSLGDVGLRRAIKWLYNFDSTPNPSEISKISEPWKPFRSVASLYLWEVINSGLIYKNRQTIFK